jgi:uncharacterized radical SAM superfamily protein
MEYYYPGKKFSALSVTGKVCALQCAHCQGHYLQSMIPVEPGTVVSTCKTLEKKGVTGCLISGGCDLSGKVPLPLNDLLQVKRETDLLLNVHTGLVDCTTAEKLREIDPYISFEVPTPYVLKNLYRVEATQADYFASLALLNGLKVVPHMMVGFDSPEKEIQTMKVIKKMGFSSLVVIVFTPTRRTPFFNAEVNTKKVIQTIKAARDLFLRLCLGCMRPRVKALEECVLLFDGIVAPTEWARKKVEKAGIPVVIKETCCVIP